MVEELTQEQIALVKNTIAKEATDVELELYLHDCRRHGVHPLDKLLHFTKRKGKYTPITSIDLLRSRAADTGELAGIDDAVYSGNPKAADFKATVTVWRFVQGQRVPFGASARWVEYVPSDAFMWNKMPYLMIGKCAEALALRRAFPKELAGLYASEEISDDAPPVANKISLPIHEGQANQLIATCKAVGCNQADIMAHYGVNRWGKLPAEKFDECLKWIQSHKPAIASPPVAAASEAAPSPQRTTINRDEAANIGQMLTQYGSIPWTWLLQRYNVAKASELTIEQYDQVLATIAELKEQYEAENEIIIPVENPTA